MADERTSLPKLPLSAPHLCPRCREEVRASLQAHEQQLIREINTKCRDGNGLLPLLLPLHELVLEQLRRVRLALTESALPDSDLPDSASSCFAEPGTQEQAGTEEVVL